MASSSSLLPLEDQTDEDFFDRLVEDEFAVTESHDGFTELNKSFFTTDITEEETKLEDSGNARLAGAEEDELEHGTIQAHQSLEGGTEAVTSVESSDLLTGTGETEFRVSEEKTAGAGYSCSSFESGSEVPTGMDPEIRSSDSSARLNVGVKSSGVKEVQWSAFSVDSQQFNSCGVESFSDFLLETSVVSTNQVNMNGDLSSSFTEVHGHGMNLSSYEQHDASFYGTEKGHSTHDNDSNTWENHYPGWKFDAGIGQWHQIDCNDATSNTQHDNFHASSVNLQESFEDDHLGDDSGFTSGKNVEVSYSQQTSSLMVGGVADNCKASTAFDWNQYSVGTDGYPPNMVFDPQYPGWYYDSNTQQWYTLDTYTSSIQQSSNSVQGQVNGDMNVCNGSIGDGSTNFSGDVSKLEQNVMQGQSYLKKESSWDALTNNFSQQSIHQSDASINGSRQTLNLNGPTVQEMKYSSPQAGFNSWDTVQSNGCSNNNGSAGFQNFVPGESMLQYNQPKTGLELQPHLSRSFYVDDKSVNYHEQQFHSTSYPHLSYGGNGGRSSAGRPPHALVSFGFGGKLVVMKYFNATGMKIGYNNQEPSENSVSIHNLMEVVKDQGDYFHSLSHQSFPGPLVGGNAATKDVCRWIDENIAHCESLLLDLIKKKSMKLLFSLLKISCQHYGKLRSPFGSGTSPEENDGPESAVTKLFASARANGHDLTHCMQSIPSEAQIQATSIEMQSLLVSGKRKEALECAQIGQLWGPALVLAAQLGEKFYVETVKQMAQRLLVYGSPLRTLCLLIAGQPADVFATERSTRNSFSGAANGYEQPFQSNCMLDEWEENLAVITANRTKDDELVVVHLGDCLWKEKGEVTAAHICYLVAEANFESFSDSARLCLIGADHWRYPRTYATPDAIQRTEVYEYSKVVGNSQFVLLPFQPYKLIYANMLAEIGKTSDSLRYCQASMKLLRNSSRTPEVEMWKSLLSSLEERLCGHQQGGFGENLAPAKLVGKFFTSIDRSIHRMMGTPSALPPMPQSSANGKESQFVAPKVVNSQSTMAMSSLIPSASVEGMSEWKSDTGRKSLHSRSASEPDFGRTPKQDSSNDASAGDARNKTSPSRLGRMGSQIFQKTIGWVSKSRPDRQARLGESNKFYYDEKLKRWIEEGAELPSEQLSLQAPPTVASFQNGTAEYSINNALKNQNMAANGVLETISPISSENNSGIPPLSPSPNQFSARRAGVRSRYVDTFNKGDSPANSFLSPSVPAAKPAAAAKFFIPTSPSTSNGTTSLGAQLSFDSPTLPSPTIDRFPSTNGIDPYKHKDTAVPPPTIKRFPSMNDINPYKSKDATATSQDSNGFVSPSRAALWDGAWDNAKFGKADSPGIGIGAQPSFFPTSGSSQQRNGGFGALTEELDEVELS